MQKRRKSNTKKKDEEVSNDLPVYCVCRSTNSDRFMIACDQCEEWYHGDCINVTPKQAEQIKTFYCPQCRCKNPSLEIDYKHTRSQRPKPAQNSSPANSSSTYSDQKSPARSTKSKRTPSSAFSSADTGKKFANEDSAQYDSMKDIRKQNVSDAKNASAMDIADSSSSPNSVFSRGFWPKEPDFQGKRRLGSPRARQFEQGGPPLDEDCGMCDYCRDHRKFGGPNRMKQKCRLRQCASMAAASRNRTLANSSQGARRRKQQAVQGLPMDLPSPHIQSYVDFDDEQFEVPIHLSPRSYPDGSAQAFLGHHTSVPVGSKMRRGDHRIFTNFNDLDSQTSRQYGRISIDDTLRTATHSRTKGLMSNIYPINTGDPIDYVDDDSDGDIVLPPMAPCAGPACMLTAIPGEKYCSDACKVKHNNSRAGIHSTISNMRSGICNLSSREVNPIPYNLSYPDHMYCRHHKPQNSHSNGSSSSSQMTSPSYRTQPFDQFAFDQTFITGNLRQSRGHPTFHYSPHRINHHHHQQQQQQQRSNNHSNSHPVIVNSVSRLNANTNNHHHHHVVDNHAVICDSVETAAFIDSISSVMQRGGVGVGANSNGSVRADPINAFSELGLDLPPNHSTSANNHLSPSPSGLLSGVGSCCYTTSSAHGRADVVRSGVDVPDVDDDVDDEDEGDDDEMDGSQQVAADTRGHPMYGYYMMNYGDGESAKGGRMPYANSNELRPSHRMMTISNEAADVSRVPRNSTNLTDSVQTGNALSNYLPGPDEFYTINDSDDLEINWPQETVAGVNG